MNARERYFWDLTGYLVAKHVLSPDEVAHTNEIVDRYSDRVVVGGSTARDSKSFAGTGRPMLPGILEFPKPDCDPFRAMLAHPAVVSRLNVMCGKGFRLDHGPMFIVSVKGTAGHTMHGNGDPHRPHVAYHHQNGTPYVGGVTVAWQLHDCKENQGGFACVSGSHKSNFPMPRGIRTGDDDMDLITQPVVEAGDVVFFMDSAQSHGATPWKLDTTRRSILLKYAGRTSSRSGHSRDVSPPEAYWDKNIVDGMTEEQKAIMWGPYSNHRGEIPMLDVDEGGAVYITNQDDTEGKRSKNSRKVA
ncbi:MAG: phytanoyl-CoA dioxygenase family protein [bacterium]|nr:phytanoyl-CoA dioxygenase family protein [bacterium]